MKKLFITIVLVLTLILAIQPSANAFNMQWFDTTFTFNYAYIDLPGNKVIEGHVDSWTDFDDGDQLQIKIDGITYLTDTTRAVLVYNPNLR